ncbi:tryptophan 2,3-dioxygenase [Psychrosphaera algicola]|uniref:Tryptophan 2,3-dioxygenase n=1 Tax=Psychrosphaera algicola TaxID=3023714 RepID=A0ABT5F9D9_9GAMM|nr:tryptophan 2,3-dioxygenase family protein [Psychrosphaera sp. G1-22]MDC2888153.1 tryptophan 2,3-dioxygenase family protein [Psychrosphaera sp. G1-22]
MTCPHAGNYREVEASIITDFKQDMSYGDYLQLDKILSAQQPLSTEHDEMLFIVIHQSGELWLKLAGHELSAAMDMIKSQQFGQAFKVISRVKQIFLQLTQAWNILSTLTPVDYLKFRDVLGHSSGFQSYGYRKLEFMLGNKNLELLKVHEATPEIHAELTALCHAPSIYELTLQVMSAQGLKIDDIAIDRNFAEPYVRNDSVLEAWKEVYHHSDKYFELYELAEKLMDIEDVFQNWRFKHMYTVQRVIGNKMGTGGSSGVSFLKKP